MRWCWPTSERSWFAVSKTYSVAAWSWTFAAIGLALRFLSNPSPLRRYVADASYWMYLIHVPLVLAMQIAVARLDWPAPVKLTLILAVVIAMLLLSYRWFVRSTWLGAWLNGRRQPRAIPSLASQPTPSMSNA